MASLQTTGNTKKSYRRYKPYEVYAKAEVIDRKIATQADCKPNQAYEEEEFCIKGHPVLFDEDEIAIEREEEHATGDIMCRDLTLEDLPPRVISPRPESLRGCMKRGVLDMAAAAALMYEWKCRQDFNKGSYEEFVCYAASRDFKKFCFKNFRHLPDDDDYRMIQVESSQLIADILVAQTAMAKRRVLSSIQNSHNVPPSRAALSVSNISKRWILDAGDPFVKTDLVAVSMNWTHKRAENNFVQCLSLLRYLLRRITEPPSRIKEYAIRLNDGRGKIAALKNSPENVENTLLNFVEDMLGYGRNELRPGFDFEHSSSRFFISLGRTDDEREEALDNMITERCMWRSQLLRSLQRALSDVRCRPELL